MATIRDRLSTLEQVQRRTRPALIIFLRAEQEGEPTPEQAAQIEQCKRQGRQVRTIAIVRAEDTFPGFTGLPPEREGCNAALLLSRRR